MKYSLAVCKDRKIFEIDLPKEMVKTKDISPEEIKKLDEFTYQFKTENELLEKLIFLGIVPEEYRNGVFDIVKIKTKDNKRSKERTHTGIHLESDKTLVKEDDSSVANFNLNPNDDLAFNSLFLRSYYVSNVEDTVFLKAFISYFFYAYKNVPQYATELYYLYNYLYGDPNEVSSNVARKAMSDFFTSYSEDYMHFRKLAMFRINYESKLINKERRIELEHYREILRNEEKFNNLDTEDINAYTDYLDELDSPDRNI